MFKNFHYCTNIFQDPAAEIHKNMVSTFQYILRLSKICYNILLKLLIVKDLTANFEKSKST